MIVPYLDFVNPKTKEIDPKNYSVEDFLSIQRGVKNGLKYGLKVLLDLESFDYAYYPRESQGFMVALSNAEDQPVISQDGFYISPGQT